MVPGWVAIDVVEFAGHILQGNEEEAFKSAVTSIASTLAGVAGTAAFGPLGGFIASTVVGYVVDHLLDAEVPDNLDLLMIDVPSHGVDVDSILLTDEWIEKGQRHLYVYESYSDAVTAFGQARTIHSGMVDGLRVAYTTLVDFRLDAEKELQARYEEAIATGTHTEDELRSSYERAIQALSNAESELKDRYVAAYKELSDIELLYQDAEALQQEAEAI